MNRWQIFVHNFKRYRRLRKTIRLVEAVAVRYGCNYQKSLSKRILDLHLAGEYLGEKTVKDIDRIMTHLHPRVCAFEFLSHNYDLSYHVTRTVTNDLRRVSGQYEWLTEEI
jgi:hypothetical protein